MTLVGWSVGLRSIQSPHQPPLLAGMLQSNPWLPVVRLDW